MGNKARAGDLVDHEIAHLCDELNAMAAKGQLPPNLKKLRQELDLLRMSPDPSKAAKPAAGTA